MAGSSRSSFGPVLAGGLVTAALASVAASRTWLHARVEGIGEPRTIDIAGSDGAPLALALALVALASWGVIGVSRLRARRVAVVIALAATVGVLIVLVGAWFDSDDVAARVTASRGVGDLISVSRGGWYWTTAAGALGQLTMLIVALRAAPGWPSLSSRYDAPTTGAGRGPNGAQSATGPLPDLELWKALDEGRDPTTGSNL